MEVYLKDLSKIILGKYEVICDGEVLRKEEEIPQENWRDREFLRWMELFGIRLVDRISF